MMHTFNKFRKFALIKVKNVPRNKFKGFIFCYYLRIIFQFLFWVQILHSVLLFGVTENATLFLMQTFVHLELVFFFFFFFTVNVRSEVQKPQTSIKEGLSCSSLLSDIKQAIGAEKTRQMFLALQAYKTSHNYEQMVSTVVSLLTERDEDIALLER